MPTTFDAISSEFPEQRDFSVRVSMEQKIMKKKKIE